MKVVNITCIHNLFHTQLVILLSFLKFLKVVLIKMFKILKMSAKLAITGSLKITTFQKGYDVIVFVHGITNKIFSCDSNYITEFLCKRTKTCVWRSYRGKIGRG